MKEESTEPDKNIILKFIKRKIDEDKKAALLITICMVIFGVLYIFFLNILINEAGGIENAYENMYMIAMTAMFYSWGITGFIAITFGSGMAGEPSQE